MGRKCDRRSEEWKHVFINTSETINISTFQGIYSENREKDGIPNRI